MVKARRRLKKADPSLFHWNIWFWWWFLWFGFLIVEHNPGWSLEWVWFVTLVFYLVKARSVMKLLGKFHIWASCLGSSDPFLDPSSNPRTQTLCSALQTPLQIDNICWVLSMFSGTILVPEILLIHNVPWVVTMNLFLLFNWLLRYNLHVVKCIYFKCSVWVLTSIYTPV